ncbi:MAG: 6-bladed beta-propeller [Calditrichaceae bacterium]
MIKRNFWIVSLTILILLPVLNMAAENQSVTSDSDYRTVKWTGQFSSSEDLKAKPGFAKLMFNFIFGNDFRPLIRPVSVFTENPDSIWVLDQGSKTLIFIDQNSGQIKNYYQNNQSGFPSLICMCRFNSYSLLLTDSKINQIYIQNITSGKSGLLNPSLKIDRPTGIGFSDLTNEIWVAETGKHRIQVLDKEGNLLRTIGHRGTGAGEFNFPTFLTIDDIGNVYIVDSMNFRIQVFNKTGELVNIFGEAGDASGYFSSPKGIATDSRGHIYVVDGLFHTVQIFDKEGNFLSYFGKQGRGHGEFWLPSGIFIDHHDRIYVADSYNARIQMFELTNKDDDEK